DTAELVDEPAEWQYAVGARLSHARIRKLRYRPANRSMLWRVQQPAHRPRRTSRSATGGQVLLLGSRQRPLFSPRPSGSRAFLLPPKSPLSTSSAFVALNHRTPVEASFR